jgi:ATP-dependent RNA helicase DeaD
MTDKTVTSNAQDNEENLTFADLGLNPEIVKSVSDLGYETPSAIQAQSIPAILDGKDILGTAQTGTGKTAAFMLPALQKIDISKRKVQLLVLAPTRELAIQVAEAGQKYCRNIKGFQTLPLYGGTPFPPQLTALKRGVHAVVGTPGRIIDHLERGTLKLDDLEILVLDEADEMLRMGFIDDVEKILKFAPKQKQTALFSATMPRAIERICNQYLQDPVTIKIAAKTQTVERISQRYWTVRGSDKTSGMVRMLEAEDFDGVIVFCRTKIMTQEVAEKLNARGFRAEPLNGDMAQDHRERVINNFKKGGVDIVVATDVAARGIDVVRVSHVINFDIPQDVESYVHRIGRTGRAGRDGQAIVLVYPREMRMLRTIENVTRQKIAEMVLPTNEEIRGRRFERFQEKIAAVVKEGGLETTQEWANRIKEALELTDQTLEAALLQLLQDYLPIEYNEPEPSKQRPQSERSERGGRNDRGGRNERGGRPERGERPDRGERKPRRSNENMNNYRIEVGREHHVRPGDIVGAIANEIDLDSAYIGEIVIQDNFSTVQLPDNMPNEVLGKMKTLRVRGVPMDMKPDQGGNRNGNSDNRKRPGGDRPEGERPRRRRRPAPRS